MTKYNKFPKKWDFHNNKNRHSCHFLAQNWGNLAADYEGYGHTYDLPGTKLAAIDAEFSTGNVLSISSR